MAKKKYTIGIALVLIVLTAFFIKIGFTNNSEKEKGREGKDKNQRRVEVMVVQPSLLINEISVSGALAAYDEVELKNEVSGRVVMINLPEGKFVKKGTLLVKLFDEDLQANLRKLTAQYNIQQQIHKRQGELLKVNGISQNEYDQTGLQISSLKADIEVQKTLIRKTEVLAPFDGEIGLRQVSVGAIVNPSTLLATIRTTNKIKLDFSVPEKYSALIKNGMKVQFTLSNQQTSYDATVMATERGIDSDTRNLKVRAMVNSKAAELIPGTFATVNLRLSENNHALMIPTQAIIPQEQNKKVIIARNGKAHFVKIKTGIRRDADVEVISGLQAGDSLITTGLLFLKEDARLKYNKAENKQSHKHKH